MLYDGLLVEYLVWATLVDTRVSGIVGVGGAWREGCVACVFLVACDGYVCGVRVCGVSVPASLQWLVAIVLLLVVVSSMAYTG